VVIVEAKPKFKAESRAHPRRSNPDIMRRNQRRGLATRYWGHPHIGTVPIIRIQSGMLFSCTMFSQRTLRMERRRGCEKRRCAEHRSERLLVSSRKRYPLRCESFVALSEKLAAHLCRKLTCIQLLIITAHAVGQSSDLHLSTPDPADMVVRGTPFLFSERLAVALDSRAHHVFADRLHAFNVVKWKLELGSSDSETFPQRTTSAAQAAFTKSVTYSLRDAVAESPLMVWLEGRQEFIATLLRESIDSVEEEAVSPLDGSYGLVERSWWKSLRQDGAIRYGIRPFRTSPYAFTSFAVRDREEVLFMSHVRYFYDDLADHRFEIAMSVPLAYGYTFDVGTAYQFGYEKAPARMAMKIFKELRTGGIAHLGLEMRERPTLLAGITFLW
jgi:hypothetical protein